MIYDPKAYLQSLLPVYREEVISGLNFWADHGIDWEKGGMVVYLDRQGNWFLDEKQGWFTGRGMYSFAKGYNDILQEPRWLEAALNLYDFMNAHQFAPNGKLYHHMNREGSPCRPDPRAGEWPSARGDGQSYGLHDESFAVMGLAELYKATGREDIKASLYKMVELQQFIYHNPKYFSDGIKNPDEKAPKVGMGDYMSLLCSVQTARECDPERKDYYTALLSEYVERVFEFYYDADKQLLYEREIECPGHSMEVAWFMLAEGLYTKNKELVNTCAQIIGNLFTLGWDPMYGGFNVFANVNGGPAFEINGNLKYWWPNNELEIGLMYSYIGTGDQKFLELYRRAHEWVFAHFPDREYGEWYGYLNHDGTPSTYCKGDHSKGAYHLYRSFYAIYNLISAYLDHGDNFFTTDGRK